jgi:hypothetical protein
MIQSSSSQNYYYWIQDVASISIETPQAFYVAYTDNVWNLSIPNATIASTSSVTGSNGSLEGGYYAACAPQTDNTPVQVLNPSTVELQVNAVMASSNEPEVVFSYHNTTRPYQDVIFDNVLFPFAKGATFNAFSVSGLTPTPYTEAFPTGNYLPFPQNAELTFGGIDGNYGKSIANDTQSQVNLYLERDYTPYGYQYVPAAFNFGTTGERMTNVYEVSNPQQATEAQMSAGSGSLASLYHWDNLWFSASNAVPSPFYWSMVVSGNNLLTPYSLSSNGGTYIPIMVPDGTYSYTITVPAGWTAWYSSGQITVSGFTIVPVTFLPPPPTGIAQTGATTTNVSIGWTNPSGVTTPYTIFWMPSGCGKLLNKFTAGAGATSYTVTGQSAGTQYCYDMAALLNGVSGGTSASMTATTLTAAPGSFGESAATASSITMSWTAPTTNPSTGVIASYTMTRYDNTCTQLQATYTGISATALSYTVNSVAVGTQLCFYLAAVDAGGTGTWTSATHAATLTAAPGSFGESAATASSITMSWTAPTTNPSTGVIASYTMTRYDNTCTQLQATYTGISATALSYTVNSVAVGTQLCFYLAAVDAGGTGTWTSATQAATLTAAPTSLAAGTVTSKTIPLTWTAPSTTPSSGVITSYTVLQATYSGGSCGSYSTSYSTGNSSTSYTVKGLTTGAAYCFEVKAVDSGGTSGPSAALTDIVPMYTVTFTASGLPGETSWSVTLGGTQHNSTTSTIMFTEVNGTYSYTDTAPSGYGDYPSHGSVTVSGSNVQVTIAIQKSCPVGVSPDSGVCGGSLASSVRTSMAPAGSALSLAAMPPPMLRPTEG